MPKFKKKPPTKPGFYEVRNPPGHVEDRVRLVEVIEKAGVLGFLPWERAPEVQAVNELSGCEWRPTKKTWRSTGLIPIYCDCCGEFMGHEVRAFSPI